MGHISLIDTHKHTMARCRVSVGFIPSSPPRPSAPRPSLAVLGTTSPPRWSTRGPPPAAAAPVRRPTTSSAALPTPTRGTTAQPRRSDQPPLEAQAATISTSSASTSLAIAARRPHHRLYGDAPEPLPSLSHYGPLHQPDPSTSGAAFACLRHLRQNLFGPMISGSMDHVWTDVILNCRCSWRVAAILVGRIYARPRPQSIHCTSV
ncbi:atherin-like [Triticum aestivum]|uniref:atherin-like n=1 Tax=Triticum aestivum TaxID=4565 RepID=UPI001D00AF7A|nr:atherin-like [Triticum aestivum]